MSWADFEERYGERREEHEDDPYSDQKCPECGESTFNRTFYSAGSRYGPVPEPPCEEWECSSCDYSEG